MQNTRYTLPDPQGQSNISTSDFLKGSPKVNSPEGTRWNCVILGSLNAKMGVPKASYPFRKSGVEPLPVGFDVI